MRKRKWKKQEVPKFVKDAQKAITKASEAPDIDAPPPRDMEWFSDLFGFAETDRKAVYRWLSLECENDVFFLHSRVNDKKYQVGKFATPSLGELRARAADQKLLTKHEGHLRFSVVVNDVSYIQTRPENRHSVFQVASQFNCLEFAHPQIRPEDGVTGYVHDRTQGPACSVSAGPATVVRNYFLSASQYPPCDGAAADPDINEGKTQETIEGKQQKAGEEISKLANGSCSGYNGYNLAPSCDAPLQQLNNLCDLSARLGNDDNRYFTVANGYTFGSTEGLQSLQERLAQMDQEEIDALRMLLRVGLHTNVQVTSGRLAGFLCRDQKQLITQVFGSATSITYSHKPSTLWSGLSRVILEASYEACLLATLENAERYEGRDGSRVVYLTLLGAGVFGTPTQWVFDAIERACALMRDVDLHVKLVFINPGDVDQRVRDLCALYPA